VEWEKEDREWGWALSRSADVRIVDTPQSISEDSRVPIRRVQNARQEWLEYNLNKEGGYIMKVCVPTLGQDGLNDTVAEHFGRAPIFTVVDIKTNTIEIIPNSGEHMGGSGLPPEFIANAGTHILICSGLGPKAVGMFERFGIEVFIGACGTVRDAIATWQMGLLHEATDENACMEHRHE
jgi:predicted Fe-Mo cluster-binding NifX family protein